MTYFHHNSIENYTIALLDLFNDIHIIRYNEDGSVLEDINVPITFGSKEKAYYLNKTDMINLQNRNYNILPRMVLSFNSMSKALDRNTNQKHKIHKKSIEDNNEVVLHNYFYNGMAYDFNFTVYIATKTFSDATVIIEQIATIFRPDITLKIYELDIQDEPTSIPVQLGEFEVDLPDVTEEDEIRVIQCSFDVTLKGNLYPIIKEDKIIKDIVVNTREVYNKANLKASLYELNEDTIINAKIDITPKDEYLNPTNNEDIEIGRETANIDVTEYNGNGDIIN